MVHFSTTKNCTDPNASSTPTGDHLSTVLCSCAAAAEEQQAKWHFPALKPDTAKKLALCRESSYGTLHFFAKILTICKNKICSFGMKLSTKKKRKNKQTKQKRKYHHSKKNIVGLDYSCLLEMLIVVQALKWCLSLTVRKGKQKARRRVVWAFLPSSRPPFGHCLPL